MTTRSQDEEIQEIRRVAMRWTAAVEAGDIELLGRLMTEDIVVIHGNGRLVCGGCSPLGRSDILRASCCMLTRFATLGQFFARDYSNLPVR
jgi:hypothetical protein